jgi:diguanylate cyclase (GGDEF)-like protein
MSHVSPGSVLIHWQRRGGQLELVVIALLAALSAGLAVGAISARRATGRIAAAAEALLAAQPGAIPPGALPGNLDNVIRRVAERLASVELLATTDQLTGVMNRPACLQSLDAEITRASRHDRSLAVALVDIDHFKKVNDTYGHAAGDIVLHHVAQLLKNSLRTTDIVGRYGGEEFLVALPETEVDGATEVAEKLRRLVGGSAIGLPDGGDLTVTVSVGLAVGVGRALGLAQITRDADGALYAAKAMGRDQVYVFRAVDEDRVCSELP